MRFALATGLMLVTLAAPTAASATETMRCRDGLVSRGDRKLEVVRKCGEPQYRDDYAGAILHGGLTPGIEEWYYDRGRQRLVHVLRFQGSRLHHIRTEGYGVGGLDGQRCDANDIKRGLSKYELLSRCGEPVSREVWFHRRALHHDGLHLGYYLAAIEEWAYDLGPNNFLRFVRIEEGRVTDVDLGDRGG